MINLLQSRLENSEAVVISLIKELSVNVSKFTAINNLNEHPEYPSLLAISDSLNGWRIPHETYRIDKADYNAEDLSFPLIAHFKDSGGRFLLIHGIANGKVTYTNEREKKAVMEEAEFLRNWDGIILYAQKEADSGEENYNMELLKGWFDQARAPFLVLLLLTCIAASINYSGISVAYAGLLAVKLVGLVVSVLLLMHSIDGNNPFIQNLCSLGKENNCNAILKSDAAKVTSWLSWSEVGMFYFAGSFLCLLLYPQSISLLAWLCVASLPYTFYSIGYQMKIKNWCVLCCTIQGVLWLEAFAFLMNSSFTFNIPFSVLPAVAICFLLPIAIWAFIKPFLTKAGQTKHLKQQLKGFKYNSDLFNKLLTGQPRYAVPEDLKAIRLGNPNAETIITMVTNPFCGPCAATHKMLDEWLLTREDLQLKILFTTANKEEDARTKVARHVTALSLSKDGKYVGEALNGWYKQSSKDYDTWASQYPVSINEEMNTVTEKQKAWCEMAEITFTPTILVNGYKLMDPYRLEDIQFMDI
jgi:hypothetical protein